MSSSVHVDNKKRHFDSWRRSKQELDNTTLTAEKAYSVKFIVTRKNFCFSLLYNGAKSYLFVNGFVKAKDSKINEIPLCLGNVSKDFSVDNMKKT